MSELTKSDLERLNQRAHQTLDELVEEDGIKASVAAGWDGPYDALFGRDGEITEKFTNTSTRYGGSIDIAKRALSGMVNFGKFQGQANVAATGERVGGLPHEVRDTFNDEVHGAQHGAGTNELPWFVDYDGDKPTLKNYDTADSTPLWVSRIIQSHDRLGVEVDEVTAERLRKALGWIVDNMEQHDGLVGFTGAGLQQGRIYSGLHNQGWQDSEDAYQLDELGNAPHPIKDALVNAQAWAALRDGAAFFAESDPGYSQHIQAVADGLQGRFNSIEDGFVLESGDGLAQAIDGNGNKLTHTTVDQGGILWARTLSGELCVSRGMEAKIVQRMMAEDMFNPEAGIRNYSTSIIEDPNNTKYHYSSRTYWPFKSGEVAAGMLEGGYVSEARQVMAAMLKAIRHFGTNIEMFSEAEDGSLQVWKHPNPNIGQESSREQAWTAGAVYLATTYLLYELEHSDTYSYATMGSVTRTTEGDS